jgi:hypothetical protein
VIPLSQDFLSRPNFLWHGQAELVQQLHGLGPFNQDLATGSRSLAGVDESLQFVDDVYDIDDNPLSRSQPFLDRISKFRVQRFRHIGRDHLPDVST